MCKAAPEAQLGGGCEQRHSSAKAAWLPPPARHRFVTVGPPVSMETQESTTALCWHFGFIDGTFSQLQLLSRQEGQESPAHALLGASLKAEKCPWPEEGSPGGAANPQECREAVGRQRVVTALRAAHRSRDVTAQG